MVEKEPTRAFSGCPKNISLIRTVVAHSHRDGLLDMASTHQIAWPVMGECVLLPSKHFLAQKVWEMASFLLQLMEDVCVPREVGG